MDERPRLEEVGGLRRDEVPWELDRKLAGLCRERAPLRAVLARVAARLVDRRAWERLGYARLSDYATERLGLSARSVRDMAGVGQSLSARPHLEHALASGILGWTKVRLLERLPREEDEVAWIAYARRVTAQQLSEQVRAVDRGSLEAGAFDEESARSRFFAVRCTPEVRWRWHQARGAAARAAGRMLPASEAAELIAAEVLSALPIDARAEEEAAEREAVSWGEQAEAAGEEARSERAGAVGEGSQSARVGAAGSMGEAGRDAASPPVRPPGRQDGAEPPQPVPPLPRLPLPPALRPLLERLDGADAFDLDARLRHAVSLEQRLEARIGPLLAEAWPRWVHRAVGYATREAWARERLGMDPTRARALVRLERAVVQSEPFDRAYRAGALSWVKASALVPILGADPLGWFVEDWVDWAGQVTVRRLREDVELALALSETDPGAFRRTGGLPPEVREEREIGATRRGREGDATEGDREIGAAPMEREEDVEGGDREIGAARREPERDVERAGREIGAGRKGADGDLDKAERGIGATPMGPGGNGPAEAWFDRRPRPPRSAPLETCWARFIGPADVVQLFRALLCTVRRRMEHDEGRLPTNGEALGAMLDHVLASWGALDGKIAARHKVFARDGWRCAAPGCTSMQNLHDHHIRFRSAGGSDALENRITLCAFHHLRGVHAGILGCAGRAPDALKWEMGIRPGVKPLLTYRSGDLRVSSQAGAR